jgi:type IV secretory pathway VirB4 component
MELLKPKENQSGASTQRYVDVEEIREGLLVLKNGSLRAILLVSSLNFDLKSSQEQDGIISQYQNFLNTLDFPVQIVISSKRFDVAPYLQLLADQESTQENELLRFQIAEYKTFIQKLTEVSNIMSKYFYVVVPFSPAEDEKNGLFNRLTGIFSPEKNTRLHGELFESYRGQLYQRVEQVSAALSGTGVRATALNTEEIIELLYDSYNPSLFVNSNINNVSALELN